MAHMILKGKRTDHSRPILMNLSEDHHPGSFRPHFEGKRENDILKGRIIAKSLWYGRQECCYLGCFLS